MSNPINDLSDGGRRQFAAINKQLAAIVKQLEPLPQMQKDISATKEIVEAWNAIKVGGKFIRWIAPIAAPILAFWIWMKTGISRWL